jgi:hypothetical protein
MIDRMKRGLGSGLRFAILCHSPLLVGFRFTVELLNDLGASALESQSRRPDIGFDFLSKFDRNLLSR